MNNKLNTFQRVRELEGWAAVAFATTLVERMSPNFRLFCQACEFEGNEQFEKSLNVIWEWLSQQKMKVNWATHIEKVEEMTPDAADFDSYGVFPAIDAAISLTSTMYLAKQDDLQGAVVVSKLSQGSVEAFIEATSEEELSAQDIKAHPLMQWEIGFQNALLDFLSTAKRNTDSVKALREMATVDGISNIGIERE
ncbi:YjaG family protein [Aestuariibacter sp. AA17]|uniref:YjaG family protein n=1 Tax=Fluctibacter corallii TaxID=2984329 RepID=A0ABT3ABH9_9ALTE|nr:YjaG family protein [Aestuariibacter sp. AA17]MCV2885646.1 YjaG family protein [Aestuariibacter sp. AA17]